MNYYLHALVLLQVAFPWALDRFRIVHGQARGREGLVLAVYGLWLLGWGITTAVMSWYGVYTQDDFLQWLPGLWLWFMPWAVALLPLGLFPGLDRLLDRVGRSTPPHRFAWLHTLRLGAVFTVVLALQTRFPLPTLVLFSLPEIAYGVVAVAMVPWIVRGRVGLRAWRIWNGAGVVAGLGLGLVGLNLSIPGPLQVFATEPTAAIVLDWPLALASTATVPWFALVNLWALQSVRGTGPHGHGV